VELTNAQRLPPFAIELTPLAANVNRLKVSFLTPTELKSGGWERPVMLGIVLARQGRLPA